ncbi:MAG: extracellular solute-binding protein [Candidatus Bathyarchaeia archaeon]
MTGAKKAEENVSRRRWIKYVGAGAVAAAVVGAGAYYGLAPGGTPPTTSTTSAVQTSATISSLITKPWGEPADVQVQWNAGPQAPLSQANIKYWNDNYAQSTGITGDVTVIPYTGYFDKLIPQMVSDAATPDIFIPWSLHTGMLYKYVENLDPYLADKDLYSSPQGEPYDVNDILGAAREACSWEGHMYFFPEWIGWIPLYRLNDVVTEAPKDYDDLLDWARKCTKSVNPKSPTKYGFVLGGSTGNSNWKTWLAPYWAYGGTYFKPNTFEPDFDSDAGHKAMEFYFALAKEHLMPPDVTTYEFQETWGAMQSGDVASGLAWSFIKSFSDPTVSPKVAGRMIPSEVLGPTKVSYADYGAVGINSDSKNKKQAFKLWAWHFAGEGADMNVRGGESMPLKHQFTDEFMNSTVVDPMGNKGAPQNIDMQTLGYFDAQRAEPAFADASTFGDTTSIVLSNTLAMKYKSADEAVHALQDAAYNFLKDKGTYGF